jgi:hypothetical protein
LERGNDEHGPRLDEELERLRALPAGAFEHVRDVRSGLGGSVEHRS